MQTDSLGDFQSRAFFKIRNEKKVQNVVAVEENSTIKNFCWQKFVEYMFDFLGPPTPIFSGRGLTNGQPIFGVGPHGRW